jgi:hypothetical protein
MDLQHTPIARITSQRFIGVCADGSLRLVWGDAVFRIPPYELQHLANVLDAWEHEEELPGLRRGYYRLVHGPDGDIQLWMNNAALCLSREELRMLTSLVRLTESCLSNALYSEVAPPFGQEYRVLAAVPTTRGCLN